MIYCQMAYYWYPTKEDKNYLYILSFFWSHQTVCLHIQQVYWVTILCTIISALLLRANANGSNNIYHLEKSQLIFSFKQEPIFGKMVCKTAKTNELWNSISDTISWKNMHVSVFVLNDNVLLSYKYVNIMFSCLMC